MTDTLLTLDIAGLPPWSARGLTQTLEPIDAGTLRRSVNGALIDLTWAGLRRYRSTVSGGDVQPPAFDAFWRGLPVTVGCLAELGRPVALSAGLGTATLEREPVAGSLRGLAEGGMRPFGSAAATVHHSAGAWQVEIDLQDAAVTGPAWLWYRPRLLMRVIDWSTDTEEWAARAGWTLTLEEA